MPSYYSPEMLAEAARAAEEARPRVAEWMARLSLNNMLHLDPEAATPFGGSDQLLERLKASYQRSLEMSH